MIELIGGLVGLATDVAKVAVAPVEIAVEVARAVTKPVADFSGDVVDAVRESLDDD